MPSEPKLPPELDLTGKTAVVLDVHGILYQVFHTMREMSGPKGQPTGAAFGFIRDAINILLRFHPDYAFCAFDLPGPTFRHRIDPQYKANRPPMPDDLHPQTGFVRRLIDGLCIARLESPGYEADDILATVARTVSDFGGNTILVTADKDARQLITEKVRLYNLRKEANYAEAELMADWGIRPDQVVDFQTMVGDSTDNVPGIPLIGPKSASALLQQYGTLENIFAHSSELKGKKRENIEAGREQAQITRQLVKLDDQVPIAIDWDSGQFRGIDPDRLKALFNELGFRSLLSKITELAEQFGTQKAAVPDNPDAEPALLAAPDKTENEPNPPKSKNEIQTLYQENRAAEEKLFRAIGIKLDQQFDFPRTDAFDAPPLNAENIDYCLVDTPEKFDRFLTELKKAPVISLDTETVDSEGSAQVRPRFALLAGLSFCFDASTGWYLPIRAPLGCGRLDEKTTLEALRPVLESPSVLKMGQNIKFDKIVLKNAGFDLRGIFFDTMVADYLLHAGEQRHNLDDLADRYLNYQTIPISDLIGVGKKQKKMNEVPTDLIARYAGEDALIPWRLYPLLLEPLQKNEALIRLLAGVEIPLIDVLADLESNGIAVDFNHFTELGTRFTERLADLEQQIRDLAKDADEDPEFAASFNINSPKQLQRILFDDLHLPVVKKTKTGRSTDFEVLEQLADYHPLPAKLIEHRTAAKLKGTYIDPIPAMVHPATHRIHASFNQVVTATGRLSSSDPNLQNIPVRTEEGKLIRQGFIPDQSLGFDRLVSCDYSQIELRVLTHYSQDKHLTDAFAHNIDVHTAVAGKLFHVPIEEVNSAQRRTAKTVNFGLIYGQSAFGLAKKLGIAQKEAADFIRTFFETYPGIRGFLDRVLEECRAKGYVETLLGRRRLIEGVRGARGGQSLNMPERTAINTVIQGSAADLMKLAMINVRRKLAEINGPAGEPVLMPKPILPPAGTRSLFDEWEEEPENGVITTAKSEEKTRLLLQIHDELVLETTADFAPELSEIVQKEMELGQPLRVPLKVDAEIESRWGGDIETAIHGDIQ